MSYELLQKRVDDLEAEVAEMKKRYDGHIQNVVKAIVVAALLVLWKPFSDFWQSVQGSK